MERKWDNSLGEVKEKDMGSEDQVMDKRARSKGEVKMNWNKKGNVLKVNENEGIVMGKWKGSCAKRNKWKRRGRKWNKREEVKWKWEVFEGEKRICKRKQKGQEEKRKGSEGEEKELVKNRISRNTWNFWPLLLSTYKNNVGKVKFII